MSDGFTPDDLTQALPVEYVIDCDADPLIPYPGWTVEEHIKGGQVIFDRSKLALYLSERQRGKNFISRCEELREELADKRPCNANFLDWLLEHQDQIPEPWQFDAEGYTLFIYFWGTLYRDSDGDLCVRYLFFCEEEGCWQSDYTWLDCSCDSSDPALVQVN